MQNGFRAGAAKQIGDTCKELQKLAIDAGLPFLAYILAMAIVQAKKHQEHDGAAEPFEP